MADYTDDINGAYDDILEAGTLATLSRVTSSYDPVAGEPVVTAVQTDPVAVLAVPASESVKQQYENSFLEDLKKGKARFFMVAAKGLTFEPEANDLLVFQNKIWELAGSTPLDLDGASPIYHTVGAKVSNLSTLPTVP